MSRTPARTRWRTSDGCARGREPDPELLEVYVDTAPEVLRYLEDHTPLSTHIQPLPDYYWPWHFPGTKMQPGRTVEADPYPVRDELPDWADRIVKRGTLMSLGAATTLTEDLAGPTPELEAELRRREERDIRPKGAALVARLFKGLLERGVETWLESPAREVVTDDHGDVVGLVVDHEGSTVRLGARKGVVLACGGFEWNPALVRGHLGYDVHPLSPGGNTGDGLMMAQQARAELGNMDSYWGTPVMFDPEITRDGRRVPQFEWGRGAPASIVVNRKGRRFANEALPYNDFPKAFGVYDTEAVEFPNAGPGFQIFDRTVRDSQRVLSMHPGQPDPDWVVKADSIRELAEAVGLDPDALEATVERFNSFAAEGVDPDFHRHEHGLMAPGRDGADRGAAVLRRRDPPGDAGHQRGSPPRPQRPGPACGRRRGRRALRRGQHRGQRVRLGLPERWGHARQRRGVRLPRRAVTSPPEPAREV